ncbi:P-loop NTPase fold protein [Pricia sp. S334]|uniref:P-loop NTPase fold protein n=1 Tax=Pricia mediterranea TaxID=3076079 RepID=A0ABU3L561_9FLAO|nr:P-loop NTPase fold protein [Pricia sp. S334]MDT7828860.1 P-loop NTPase fold protein [Pricia sp. S334]
MFLPQFDGLKYLDIIFYIALLHVILLFTNRKNKLDNTHKDVFFLEDKIHDGEIDNELVLNELIRVTHNLKTENSFTIGLNAPWGYGKSTFLNRFHKKYSEQNENAIIFWYSIWKNKGSTAIIDNFFQLLANELKPFSGEIDNEIDKYVNEILQIAPSEYSGILKSGKKLLFPERTTEEHYDRINAIIRKIDRQIVVLLDDLDRLESEEILDSFKLIRALSDFNNVVFIAGYNRDYIVNTCGRDKKDYINKIFQVEINMLPFDEKRIREVILDEVRRSFPTTEDDSLNLKLFQGFDGLFDKTSSYTPKIEDLFIGMEENSREYLNLNWFRFLNTYRDIKRFTNEFKFNYIFINEKDIIPKEFILLKLLFFKYRELQQTIFLHLEDILSIGVIDSVNDKIHPGSSGYGGVYIYDEAAYKKLSDKLRNYKTEDQKLIDAVFLKLFGEKDISYYTSNQNCIAQIYHTNTYVRNNIAGAKYKISDFDKAYEEQKLEELISEIKNYTPQTKSQVLNELKRFLLTQEIKTKDQFIEYITAVNMFFGQNTITEDQNIINRFDHALKENYNNNKAELIKDLSNCINISQIGYLERLLSDININEKRKLRPDLYNSSNMIDYENVVLGDVEIKNILIEKLNYAILETSQVGLIIDSYHLYTEFIATDHQIIRANAANDLIQKDIKARFIYYFWKYFFDFHETSGGTSPTDYRQYAPNDFLCQIFSRLETLNKLKKKPKDKKLFDQFEKEGWLSYYRFLCSLKTLSAHSGEFTLERLEKIKKLLRAFIKKGYRPLNQDEYTNIWNT